MTNAPVKVTVLITLYNKGAFVEEAIQSVLANTFMNYEVLVVDDASTDGGLEKVKAIADPRIRILESTMNTGRAAAANRGYDAARGEYVAVLDADDQMYPDRMAKQVAYMDANAEVGVCGSWLQAFGTSAVVLEKPLSDAAIRSSLLLGLQLSYPSCIIRRSVVRKHAVRCNAAWLTPGMDHLFLVSIGLHSAFANIPEVLTKYRVGEQNMDHGRDRTADRRLLARETFRLLAIPASQEDVDLHLMLANLHTTAPTPARVRSLAEWLDRLKAHNRSAGLFPVAAFELHLDTLWNRSFYLLTDLSLASGWAHLGLTKGEKIKRLYYWARRIGRSRSTPRSAVE